MPHKFNPLLAKLIQEISPESNFSSTSAPGITDDNTEGYLPGSFWVNITAVKGYICLDNTTGAAVWTEITAGITPALHAGTHVTGGGDTVADAIAAGNSGLMSGADKTKIDGIEALADVTDAVNISSSIVGADNKATPIDTDSFGIIDSAAANVLKELTWTNIKATLKTYFDSVSQILTNKSIDSDNNTITNIVNADIKAAASIVESKLSLDNSTSSLKTSITVIENDIDYPTTIKQKAITDTGEDGGVEGGVFNGDFEYGSGSQSANGWVGDEKYGWRLYEDVNGCTASFDSDSYSGNQCLKFETTSAGAGWIGLSAGLIQNLPNWRIPVINDNSTQYKLFGRMKCENVEATKIITLVISGINDTWGITDINTITIASGTQDWTYFETIFTVPTTYVNGIRFHIKTNDTINASTFWIDDIKLEQIDTQTVNTQLDEPVSVSIEGVTTTDNIDQYLETSGQTYTTPVAINEGATHRQTFTPTADRGDGKHLLTKIQALVAAVGTGNWTVTVHDAANNVLASTTIVNGSMSTGDIDFDVPAILGVGTAYHFHITSTVADGTITTTDANDLETVDYHAQFAKHTESPIVEANGSKLDMTGVKLLTGATITVNVDGSGKYLWDEQITDAGLIAIHDLLSTTVNNFNISTAAVLAGNADNVLIWKYDFSKPAQTIRILTQIREGTTRSGNIYYSFDNVTYILLHTGDVAGGDADSAALEFILDGENHTVMYLKYDMNYISADWLINYITVDADFDCQTALPIFSPSSEVTTETADLVQNPIDISEDGYWQLKSDLTGWSSRTFSMLASESAFESQAVSANYIYMYDSNGTTPWAWDERSGLVPPADRTSGVAMVKFQVGDNQIKSSVNDGSMKANVNLSWDEESLRAAMNRLTELANLQYPIVVEVEDVPAIDIQDQPTGASAETGYTNDVTSLRQTAAATPAIAYTGLLPSENQFSEWLDITIVCSDGDGTLQGKLYTADGTLIETYADLESNHVITISNHDYKYSRERLILQISASLETTASAWSVTDIKWRYQYNG